MRHVRILFWSIAILIVSAMPAFADTFTTYTETLTTTAGHDGANGVTFNVTFVADTTKDTFTMSMQVQSSSPASPR
jgi:hypothetical protein